MALKDERIELRLTRMAKTMLQKAAAVRNKTVSEFVVDSGLTAAAETLADRQHFVLPEKKWKAFQTALDAPTTKAKPRLGKLLKSRSVLE
jgi:uncharacterized protein (DUF1778 family)